VIFVYSTTRLSVATVIKKYPSSS